METVAVIDFETTGLSPAAGDRASEVAAVILEQGKVVGRYHSLMNAGIRIPSYIEALTGITNEMVKRAPWAEDVMSEVSEFVGDIPLVAHNAAFDRKFWDAELARINKNRTQEFACSMLLSRRIFPKAPSHKLGVLVEFAGLPITGQFHRALADAEMTASLLTRLEAELISRHNVKNVTHEILRVIQQTPKNKLVDLLKSSSMAWTAT